MDEPIKIDGKAVSRAIVRACEALAANSEAITSLDQAMGDGDLGITANKIAKALKEYVQTGPSEDIGKFVAGAGMATNKAASSTMGTLIATALMRAGMEVKGAGTLTPVQLASMLHAASRGIQERGKANLGDKTVLDALHPAVEAFDTAIKEGESLEEAGRKMLAAAVEGRDRVTPLRSHIGRASWVGERTEGLVDPGCELLVTVLRGVIEG
jgi:dihydroxyacetone kinase